MYIGLLTSVLLFSDINNGDMQGNSGASDLGFHPDMSQARL